MKELLEDAVVEANEKMIVCSNEKSSWLLMMATPRTAQFVVIR